MLDRQIAKSSKTEDISSVRRWEDLDHDILVKIFQCFDILELTSGVAHVCSSWRKACCDPFLWKTLDLSMFQSDFNRIRHKPYVHVESRSEKELTELLKISLNLSRGNITSMFFHCKVYLSEEQLTYVAERTPRLRRLVLPAWHRIRQIAKINTIRMWKDLESLTMPGMWDPYYIFEEIADNCKNFSQLKVMGPVHDDFTYALVAYLPKLRVLSLRYAGIDKEDLIFILDCLRNLEVLNINHALILETPEPPFLQRLITEFDQDIIEKASRLKEFLTCLNDDGCTVCENARDDEGLMRWYRFHDYEELWRADEVSSLAR